VASLLFEAPDIDNPRKAANEGLRRLQARTLEPKLRQIELEIATNRRMLTLRHSRCSGRSALSTNACSVSLRSCRLRVGISIFLIHAS